MNWSDFNYEMMKDPPDFVFVSTFNFWTAFSNWRGCTPLPPVEKMCSLQKFLYLMNQTNTGGVIVITPPKDRFKRISDEIILLKRLFPNIKCLIHNHNHSKMIVFGHVVDGDFCPDNSRIWNSSRNFHQSETEQFHEIILK